ncbi:MAG: hypothetical protein R3B45_13255 [Bdellovibrionota bacterium]
MRFFPSLGVFILLSLALLLFLWRCGSNNSDDGKEIQEIEAPIPTNWDGLSDWNSPLGDLTIMKLSIFISILFFLFFLSEKHFIRTSKINLV